MPAPADNQRDLNDQAPRSTKGEPMLLEKKRTSSKLRAELAVMLLFAVLSLPSTGRADAVTDWNENATAAAAAISLTGPRHTRVFAMTHAAIHDALNAIDRRYTSYVLDIQTAANASPEAAVAAAAHDVLVHEIPTQQAFFDSRYAASLAGIPDGAPKINGIAIGQAAAAAILALRGADGSTAPMPYTPGTGLGVWQPTPPGFLPANLPGWGNVTPFTLTSGSQFRPDPPALFDLTGRKYAKDYNEVKRIGEVNSTIRTAEQSEIGKFWYEGSGLGWNRIARVVSAQQGLDLWENARLFGLL